MKTSFISPESYNTVSCFLVLVLNIELFESNTLEILSILKFRTKGTIFNLINFKICNHLNTEWEWGGLSPRHITNSSIWERPSSWHFNVGVCEAEDWAGLIKVQKSDNSDNFPLPELDCHAPILRISHHRVKVKCLVYWLLHKMTSKK